MPISSRQRARRHVRSAWKPTSTCCRAATTRASGKSASEALPAGLLQRIAIARAIASRPRLLILDEANNVLDRASELALGAGLGTFRDEMTIVLITNRPSFAALADHVFTLADGKFCELDKSTLQIKPAAGRHHEPA